MERIAVVALIVILFNGGMDIGWRRFRASAAPILSIGLLGTFATAGIVALVAHYALGFDWILGRDHRRRDRAHRSGRDVLGARPARGRGALGDDPRGRGGRQRSGRDRADARHDRARDPRRRLVPGRRARVRGRDVGRGRARRARRDRADPGASPCPASDGRALPGAGARARRRALRRDLARPRLGLPRRLHHGPRLRGRAHPVQGGDRALLGARSPASPSSPSSSRSA